MCTNIGPTPTPTLPTTTSSLATPTPTNTSTPHNRGRAGGVTPKGERGGTPKVKAGRALGGGIIPTHTPPLGSHDVTLTHFPVIPSLVGGCNQAASQGRVVGVRTPHLGVRVRLQLQLLLLLLILRARLATRGGFAPTAAHATTPAHLG